MSTEQEEVKRLRERIDRLIEIAAIEIHKRDTEIERLREDNTRLDMECQTLTNEIMRMQRDV